MAENSKIEWTDHTFNPWTGCTKVSPGCDGCYAEAWAKRSGTVQWGGERRRTTAANWRQPLKWNAQAEQEGRRFRVFCASLADVFDNEVPTEWRDELWRLIEATPHLDWLLLTKRISNVQHMVWPRWMQAGFPAHVRIGATMVNQPEVDRDARRLLALPARGHFVSYEPALGPIDLTPWLGPYCDNGSRPHPDGGGTTCARCGGAGGCAGLSWVIAGGESGPKARPAHPDWFRSLRDQCAAAGVPFLFKQWGEHTAGELTPNPAYPEDASDAWRLDQRGQRWHDPEEGLRPMSTWQPVRFLKVGKKAAGRTLDGRTHDEFPEVLRG
jgi:protein gp37